MICFQRSVTRHLRVRGILAINLCAHVRKQSEAIRLLILIRKSDSRKRALEAITGEKNRLAAVIQGLAFSLPSFRPLCLPFCALTQPLDNNRRCIRELFDGAINH